MTWWQKVGPHHRTQYLNAKCQLPTLKPHPQKKLGLTVTEINIKKVQKQDLKQGRDDIIVKVKFTKP